jgi:tripartite-type tricarboxylate transporter receptor subunit TctC
VSLLPDVPTVAESGLPDYEAATWFGLVGPKAMPRDLVTKINTEVQRILSDPAFQAKFMAPQRFESMASAPEEFDSYIKSETQRWGKVIREQKLVIQ